MTFRGDTNGKGEPYSLHHLALHKMSPLPYELPELDDLSPQLEVIRKYYAFLTAFDLDNPTTLRMDGLL